MVDARANVRGTRWTITHAATDDELRAVRQLFLAYAAWLDIDLSFQDFDRELVTLPGAYAPPKGALRLALIDQQPAGCVALREIEAGIGEIKRLYVAPEYRGRGLGGALMSAVINHGKLLEYQALRLDTIPQMAAANRLYHRFGFRPIAPYYHNPVAGAVFLELRLDQ